MNRFNFKNAECAIGVYLAPLIFVLNKQQFYSINLIQLG